MYLSPYLASIFFGGKFSIGHPRFIAHSSNSIISMSWFISMCNATATATGNSIFRFLSIKMKNCEKKCVLRLKILKTNGCHPAVPTCVNWKSVTDVMCQVCVRLSRTHPNATLTLTYHFNSIKFFCFVYDKSRVAGDYGFFTFFFSRFNFSQNLYEFFIVRFFIVSNRRWSGTLRSIWFVRFKFMVVCWSNERR